VLALSLLANLWLWTSRDTSAVGHWRSTAGREAYLEAYAEVLATMPEATRSWDVQTSYGKVHARLFSSTPQVADEVPVVLLPGWGSGIPMWSENLPGLLEQRPVYAFDALGDAGRSIQSAPLDTPAAQAAWVEQTLRALGIGSAHVVGHSFGGWSATNVALHHRDRIASLSLLEPVQTFSSLRWQVYLYSIPAAIPFLPQSWRDAALAEIGGTEEIDREDAMTRMIDEGTKSYVSKRSFPTRFSDEQLRGLDVPVYAAIAGESSVNADPVAAVEHARSLLPDAKIRLWPDASHSLPMERPDTVDTEMLEFMAEHDGDR
jgi:pimeloyl-ACP methyl ester carboxylesterase